MEREHTPVLKHAGTAGVREAVFPGNVSLPSRFLFAAETIPVHFSPSPLALAPRSSPLVPGSFFLAIPPNRCRTACSAIARSPNGAATLQSERCDQLVSATLECFRVIVPPLTPDPSPPFHGGEGGISLSVLRRAADGSPRVRQRSSCIAVPDWPLVVCMEYVAPSPPPPLPLTGRGEDLVFSFEFGGQLRVFAASRETLLC